MCGSLPLGLRTYGANIYLLRSTVHPPHPVRTAPSLNGTPDSLGPLICNLFKTCQGMPILLGAVAAAVLTIYRRSVLIFRYDRAHWVQPLEPQSQGPARPLTSLLYIHTLERLLAGNGRSEQFVTGKGVKN